MFLSCELNYVNILPMNILLRSSLPSINQSITLYLIMRFLLNSSGGNIQNICPHFNQSITLYLVMHFLLNSSGGIMQKYLSPLQSINHTVSNYALLTQFFWGYYSKIFVPTSINQSHCILLCASYSILLGA